MRFLFICFMMMSLVFSQEQDYTDKMATEHEGDKPVATEMAAAEPEIRVRTHENVPYATIDEKQVMGYLAVPMGGQKAKAGIIVIQEWWGLNDNIKAVTQKLASKGYVALAVDLYGGKTAEDAETARKLMKKAMGEQEKAQKNLKQAHEFLKNNFFVAKVGSVGWCFGGHWSLRTALMMPEGIDATVIYYGKLVTDKEKLAKLDMPILGIFGELDKGIPVEKVREFEKVLGELGKNAQIHVYEGANHAFANPSGTRYNKEAAEDAWAKTLEFFATNLEVGGK